jgi:hypothetical protein
MADDERLRRVVLNEALYREVNERVEAVNEAFGDLRPDFAIVCECGTLACTEQILVPRAVYEETRSHSTRFLVLPGHQIEDMEQVVEDHGAFVVIEKTPKDAQALAEETDPREQ